MENMQYIEEYFKGAISAETKQAFEQRIISDPAFAEDVAFYVSVNGLLTEQAKQEKKEKFRELYQQHKAQPASIRPINTMWRYMAAASVLAAILLATWFFAGQKNSPEQFANKYIQQHFITQSITMGNQDSLQAGVQLFNEGKLTKALTQFKTILNSNAANSAAQKYAGIAALRLGQYDEALTYFSKMEADTNIYINPGKFYKALTLLKRNANGDKATAKALLRDVEKNNLAESDQAKKWLKKL